MKKIIAFTLIMSIGFTLLFTGCKDKENIPTKEDSIQTSILELYNEISKIPRTSGNEDEIGSYLKTWAKENNLDVTKDGEGNIIINKEASAGYESAPTTILHSNMDMTITTAEGINIDPINQPLKILSNEEFIWAEGTNAGANTGMGMATALYVLKNSTEHGPLRAIFTVNGEATLEGAKLLKKSNLDGKYLIDLTWNSGDSACIGSAGTNYYKISHPIDWMPPKNKVSYMISLTGLNGGNYIENIGSEGANPIKIIGETLANAQGQGILLEIAGFNGGTSYDTIPNDAYAQIVINQSDINKMQKVVKDAKRAFKDSHGDIENNYVFDYLEVPMPEKVVSFDNATSITGFLYGIINGVQTRSEKYDIIESASNLGVVSTYTGNFICEASAASTSEVGLYEITNAHQAMSNMCDLNFENKTLVPRWQDHQDSVLLHELSKSYNLLKEDNLEPKVVYKATELGWFVGKNPDLQIVSIGVDIEKANTAEEKVKINSIQEPAEVVLDFLKNQKY